MKNLTRFTRSYCKVLLEVAVVVSFITVQLPWFPAHPQIAEDTHRQDLTFRNMIQNPGFENGKAGWTVSGGDTFSVTASSTSTREMGKSYATWDSAGAGRVFAHVATTITTDDSNAGKNGICVANIAVPSGTATHILKVLDGSANILGSTTITSSTLPTESYTTFTMPASGTLIQCQLASVNANEPSINMYSFYMGQNYLLANVSQATLVASGYMAGTAACDNLTVTSATLAAFTADAGCLGITVTSNIGPGTLQTTDADLPRFTMNSLPPGVYKVTITAAPYSTIANGNMLAMAINDGTTTSGQTSMLQGTANGGGPMTMVGVFTYTTTANVTFNVFGAASGGATALKIFGENAASPVTFTIERFPSTPELAFRPDVGPSSWSGYHDATCSWTRVSASFGPPTDDASCALVQTNNRNFGTVSTSGSVSPAITFTPTRTGRYDVCAIVETNNSTANIKALRLTDGTTVIAEAEQTQHVAGEVDPITLCGQYDVTTISAKTLIVHTKSGAGNLTLSASGTRGVIEWSIKAIDFSMNTPVLVGGVTNSGTGAIRIESANLNCDAGSVITSQLNGSSAFATIGNISSGACAVTFTAGAFSSTPYCTIGQLAGTGRMISFSSNPTSSGFTIHGLADDGTNVTTLDAIVTCIGPR